MPSHKKFMFHILVACGLLLAGAGLRADDAAADDAVPATALTVHGSVEVEDAGQWTAVEEGQLLAEGDQVRTGEGASLHLLLADGSSLVLGPNSEVTLQAVGNGDPGSRTVLELAKGLLNTMVEKLKAGSVFEVHSGDAVAAVKGTDFEVARDGDADAAVTVKEGTVHLGDKSMAHFVPVTPGHQSRFVRGAALPARALSREERRAFVGRWAEAHRIHAQRRALERKLRTADPARRRRFLEAMRHRQALRGGRPGNGVVRPRFGADKDQAQRPHRRHRRIREVKRAPKDN